MKLFTDLIVWQEAHKLSLKIYFVTKWYPPQETFGLINQMRRCTISITSNIAEAHWSWNDISHSNQLILSWGPPAFDRGQKWPSRSQPEAHPAT